MKVYVDALEAARKLHVKNEWTKKVGESLARYRPNDYPVLKDAKASMVREDVSPAAFADTPEGPTRRDLPAPAVALEAPAPESPAEGAAPGEEQPPEPARRKQGAPGGAGE